MPPAAPSHAPIIRTTRKLFCPADKRAFYDAGGGRIRLHFFLLRGTQKEIKESTSF
jgi:hypothetical protein